MEEQTTTGDASVDNGGEQTQNINGIAIDDQGMAIPVPEDAETTTTAAETTSEEQTEEVESTTGASEEALPDVDEKLRKYAESNNIVLDSPNAVKAAQIALKAQSEATRNSQKVNELERVSSITNDQVPDDFTPEQRDNVRTRNVELTLEAMRWKQSNPDKAEYEAAMSNILMDNPNKRLMVQEGYLSLDDVYAMARGSSSDADLKTQGKREALETLRDTQQAAVPRGSAVNGTPSQPDAITPQNVDALVGSHDLAWFEKNQAAINKAMAG